MSVFACTQEELLRIQQVTGLQFQEDIRVEIIYDKYAKDSREFLSKVVKGKAVTTELVSHFIAYGKRPNALVEGARYKAKGTKFGSDIPFDQVSVKKGFSGNHGKNVVYKVDAVPDKTGMVFGNDLIDSTYVVDHFSFHQACVWLASLSSKVLFKSNKEIKFDKEWRAIEAALQLPSILNNPSECEYFKPQPTDYKDFGHFVQGKWEWNKLDYGWKYSEPSVSLSDSEPVMYAITFSLNTRAIARGIARYVFSSTHPPTVDILTIRGSGVNGQSVDFFDTRKELCNYLIQHFGSLSPIDITKFDTVHLKKMNKKVFYSENKFTSGSVNDCFAICGSKGTGKTLISTTFADSEQSLKYWFVDSDAYGMVLHQVGMQRVKGELGIVDGKKWVTEFNEGEEIMANAVSKILEVKKRDFCLYPSYFENNAYLTKDDYDEIVAHELFGFRAFSNFCKQHIFSNRRCTIVFNVHTNLESAQILGKISSMSIKPFFSPAAVMKMRPDRDYEVQAQLESFYSCFIDGNLSLPVSQIISELKSFTPGEVGISNLDDEAETSTAIVEVDPSEMAELRLKRNKDHERVLELEKKAAIDTEAMEREQKKKEALDLKKQKKKQAKKASKQKKGAEEWTAPWDN